MGTKDKVDLEVTGVVAPIQMDMDLEEVREAAEMVIVVISTDQKNLAIIIQITSEGEVVNEVVEVSSTDDCYFSH